MHHALYVLCREQAGREGETARLIREHGGDWLFTLKAMRPPVLVMPIGPLHSPQRTRPDNSHAGRRAPAKLRQGSYYPPFLEPRRTSEKALVAVIQG